MKTLNSAFLIVACLLFWSCDECPETTVSTDSNGSISGTVFTKDGKQLAGVFITTSPATTSFMVKDSNGKFLIQDLKPGVYTVRATKAGYDDGSSVVSVQSSKTVVCDIVMSVQDTNSNIDTNNLSGGGNCIQLDGLPNGAGAYVTIEHSPELNLLKQSFSFEMWVKTPNNLTSNKWLFNKGGSNSEIEYIIGTNSSSQLYFYSSYIGSVQSSTSLKANTWYHVAVSVDFSSEKATIYVNGVEDTKGSIAQPNGSSTTNLPLFIGARNLNRENKGVENWDGQIDEVRIWNKLRTQSEIFSNKNKKMNGNESGLVAYWRFDESDGLIANDKTGKSHTGVLVNNVKRVVSTAPISE